MWSNPNTVSLRSEYDDGLFRCPGWFRPVTVLGPFHAELGHLALDDSRVRAQPTGPEQLEEDLAGCLVMGIIEDLRGKNPGATPSCGEPPGCCG